MSNLTIDEENPLQMFLYGLRAAESKRQYPRRLKVFLDYLTTKGELMTDLLQDQCKEFILRTSKNPKWANNQLMDFILFQKNRGERLLENVEYNHAMNRFTFLVHNELDKILPH